MQQQPGEASLPLNRLQKRLGCQWRTSVPERGPSTRTPNQKHAIQPSESTPNCNTSEHTRIFNCACSSPHNKPLASVAQNYRRDCTLSSDRCIGRESALQALLHRCCRILTTHHNTHISRIITVTMHERGLTLSARTAAMFDTCCEIFIQRLGVGRINEIASEINMHNCAMFARVVARRLIHHRPCGGACCRGMRTMMTSVSPLYV